MARKSMPNFFVGIPIQMKNCMPWYKKATQSLHKSTRVLSPEDLHMTVAFLGKNVTGHTLSNICKYLDNIPLFPLPHYFTLEERIALPNKYHPTAVGYLVGENYELLKNFIFTHRSHLIRLSQGQPDSRIPKPHITVARPCGKSNPQYDDVNKSLIEWVQSDGFTPGSEYPILFDEICLLTWSEWYPESPLYEVVHSKKLLPEDLRKGMEIVESQQEMTL